MTGAFVSILEVKSGVSSIAPSSISSLLNHHEGRIDALLEYSDGYG
jgi:hypothetical protein